MTELDFLLKKVNLTEDEKVRLETIKTQIDQIYININRVRVPRAGPAVAEARRRLASWGSQTDLTAWVGTGAALSQLSPVRSSVNRNFPVPGIGIVCVLLRKREQNK